MYDLGAYMTSARSDLEAEPDSAAVLFGATITQARSFANALADRGEELGLIGPVEAPRLWTRHILNSVLVAPLLRTGAMVGDVGSGAGLPGLVLAIARPDVRFILIEPMERRVDWLTREASRLGLTNVEVNRARAEELKFELELDQVTARAVSSLTKLLPLVEPLVHPGGQLVLLKGAGVQREMDAASKTIQRLRLVDAEILTLGEGVVAEVTRVFRATVSRG